MVVFFGGLAASVKEARRERLITEAQGTEREKEELKQDPDRKLIDLTKFKESVKKIYRGIDKTFIFSKFIAKFNSPVSTTTQVCFICYNICYW